MEITRDVVEMWCDADARNEMLRRNPDAVKSCPTVEDMVEAAKQETE